MALSRVWIFVFVLGVQVFALSAAEVEDLEE